MGFNSGFKGLTKDTLSLLHMQFRIKENPHTGRVLSLEDRTHFVMQRRNTER